MHCLIIDLILNLNRSFGFLLLTNLVFNFVAVPNSIQTTLFYPAFNEERDLLAVFGPIAWIANGLCIIGVVSFSADRINIEVVTINGYSAING